MNPSIRVYPSSHPPVGSMDLLSGRSHTREGGHSRSRSTSPRNWSNTNVSNSLNVNLPMEGGRWSEHQNLRKQKFYQDLSEDQELKDYRSFVQRQFHKIECVWFVPKPKQADTVKTVQDLRCQCGETLANHEAMRERSSLAAKSKPVKNIVPPELNDLVAVPDASAPKILPDVDVPWNKETCLKRGITDAYGKINFNLEIVGGMKPAKYIRLTPTDSVDDLLECMKRFWRIMDPEPPSLVISVVGGAKNFKLDGRNRDIFHSGLVKAAKTTSAWLITSGFNMGVMKAVGQAVHKGQTFTWNNNRMTHKLRCIALAPWGYVENRDRLCSMDKNGSFPASYKPSNLIQHGSPVSLNPDHTHFVFVDDGMRNAYKGVAEFRALFERKISLPTHGAEESGLGIPVVLVVVEGGTDAINTVVESIEQGVPVVLCAGTGRAADILSYAFSHTITTRSGERFMQKKHIELLKNKLFDAYSKSWSGESGQAELEKYQKLALQCCEREDMITIFPMQKNEDLDLAILSALLKAKGRESLEQRQNQLRLALTWNRSDIAQEEIFREDVFWPPGSLDDIMTEALLHDRVEFVQLLIQQGFVMKGYLTMAKLEHLYNSELIPKFCHLRQLLRKIKCTDQFTLPDVRKLLELLLDTFDDPEYSLPAHDMSKTAVKFTHPYRELFLWAVLMNRQELAKLCWEMGEEPVASAVVASRLYLSLSKWVAQHESVLRQVYLVHKEEFEMLATSVLNECHSLDPDKAMMLVEKASSSWSQVTCLQLAAAANDQIFLSSASCQNSINLTWKRGLLCSWKKVLLAIICPFLIWPFIEMESMGDKQIGFFRKWLLFYKAPITKYAANSIMYLVFLCLYSYMILFDFKSYTSVTEWICITWIFTFLVDELHGLLAFPSPTIKGKFRDWYGFLNRIDLGNLILVFIGFALKQFPQHLELAKTIYCLNCVSFFLRIMKLYKANSFLGPKLYMIVRMVEELALFVSILVVFLLAYGVSSQSLLWPNRAPYWGVLKDILYYPYWQIYGEVFLEEFESDTDCISQYANISHYADVPCRMFSALVPILLAAYLLIGNVLLLNLLIAIFSHVFDEVQRNTLEIWKYQIYFLVMEYDVKTFLVPPFSLLEHIYKLMKYLLRHSCCQKITRPQYMKRHIQFLQFFEKEMMANYLRWKKAEEMNSIDSKFHKIQKRVDEMTKLIEDEVIADQQHVALMQQSLMANSPVEGRERGDGTLSAGDQDNKWPLPEELTDLDKAGEKTGSTRDGNKTMEEIAEEHLREKRKEKKKKHRHRHRHKHRHREDRHDPKSGENEGESTDPENHILDRSRSQGFLPPRPGLRNRYSNLSMRSLTSRDTDIVATPRQLRRQRSRDVMILQDDDAFPVIWSDDDIDDDMVPLSFSKNQKK